jgi:hypothetical protein
MRGEITTTSMFAYFSTFISAGRHFLTGQYPAIAEKLPPRIVGARSARIVMRDSLPRLGMKHYEERTFVQSKRRRYFGRSLRAPSETHR